ncbi:MAG: hypothetical protein ACD_49C00047G0001 [uncultured bacterium (gcode 4)]|uniref:Uncharacterized protein n=1 Tax=uncultured bacterium (gcode 4) TaxID=1234023 RepID=K2BVV6_9BACT|nr:MAG: hypothetical protein ACD_49C00047G0001 [uncultured bacterium (gcode 4)]
MHYFVFFEIMSLENSHSKYDYLEILKDDVLKSILEQNEIQLKSWVTDKATEEINSAIRLILSSRGWNSIQESLIKELVNKYNELDREWERLDSTWRNWEQESLSNEMREISKTLLSMWLDTEGNPIKTPLKVTETKNSIFRLWII